MIIKELYFYFKKCKISIILIYILSLLMILSIGIFMIFKDFLSYNSEFLKGTYEDKAIFSLTDNYIDEKFTEFFEDENSLSYVKDFYNLLDNSTEFKYLALTNQGVNINNINVPNSFYHNYERNGSKKIREFNNENFSFIKSIQLNKNSIDFFKLKVSEGITFDFNKSYDFKNLPVLLGSSYKDFYSIGDTIKLNHYNENFTGEIIGFLEPQSKIFSDDSIDLYLDNYLILPELNYKDPSNEIEERFQKLNYLNRVGGYIITKDDTSIISDMFETVKTYSEKSKFYEYVFIGENLQMRAYDNFLSIIKNNGHLISIIIFIIISCNFLILLFLLYLQDKRRNSYYNIKRLLGHSQHNIILQRWIEILIIFFLVYISFIILMMKYFYLFNIKIYIDMFLFLILLSLILLLFLYLKISRKSIFKYLNNLSEEY